MKKTALYIIMCSMASLLLASCYNDDYETGTDKTKAGKIAYDYTKAAITPFMDILTLTYKFNRYIGQENLDGRDSVDLLYFPNVKVNRTQDGPEKATVYLLRTFRSGYNRADYTVAIHNTDRHRTLDGKGATWKIHAFSEIYGDSMVYEMSIVSCGQDKWQVTQSHCAPWHMNRKVSRESAQKIYGYRHFFFCQNNHWTVEWEQPSPHSLACQVKVSGEMESVKSPKMRMRFKTIKPLKMDWASSVLQSHWNDGIMDIWVDDSIDKTTENVRAVVDDRRIVIEYMGYRDEWRNLWE
ncbi:MAG: hypothetical protein PUH24_08850 [Prevotellaceae bacterium]|nr:hypothetical protein [Prevotellaceae bacterium]MDY6129912.1 hypothetical protein [Prevotella sp.]